MKKDAIDIKKINKEMAEFFDSLASTWDEGNDERKGLRETLIRRLPINEGDDILDVGCGTGVITPLLHGLSKERVVAIDLSPKMIEVARSKDPEGKDEYFCQDIYSFEPKSNFDGAVFYNCYPHFMDVEGLKVKLASILKNDGFFAIVHNNGRGELFACHERHMHISRNMLPVLKEADQYMDYFDIELAEESDDYYLLIMRRKSCK